MPPSGLQALRTLRPDSVLTLGNFDGVHLGHRALLQRARELAGTGRRVVAVTFDPHPAAVLKPDAAPLRLTPIDLRTRLLLSAGADEVLVLPPTPDLLSLEAEDFFALLRDDARVAHLVEGENFCFGRNRRGTIDRLTEWTASAGMGLTIVPPVSVALLDCSLVAVSSSLVRFLASTGRVRDAGICLGSPLRLVGRVVEGFRRGRTLGFPTANLDCSGNVVPGDGVYAARATLDSQIYAAALNVGPLPTFSTTARQIEAHLIGFSGDLYGQTLELEVLDFLRDQRKFTGMAELQSQLHQDVRHARWLGARNDLHRALSAGVGR
jgi:riboflavin kinase/FMN adenylyltransferase